MGVTATNLIQGPATIYHAAFGATEPADLSTAFGVGWTDLGGTKDGVELQVNKEYSVLSVDQIVDEVARRVTNRAVAVKTQLAEATLENLARSINETQPTSGSFEADNDLDAFAPDYSAIGIDGIAPGGFLRRIIVRKTLATDAVGTSYKKDGMTLVPVTFSGHWVSSVLAPFVIDDADS